MLIKKVLARCPEVYRDEPDLGQRFNQEALCEAWLPLTHVDGASEELRELAWHAAGLIAERWGEGQAGHVEETIVAAAWGHATPPLRLTGGTSLP